MVRNGPPNPSQPQVASWPGRAATMTVRPLIRAAQRSALPTRPGQGPSNASSSRRERMTASAQRTPLGSVPIQPCRTIRYGVSSGHRPITLYGVSGNLELDRLSPPARAVIANVIELPGHGERSLFIGGRAWRKRVLAQPGGISGSPAPRGSQTGSQRRQVSGHIRRQPAMVGAARWPIRPRPATCSNEAMRLKSGRPAVRPRP